MTATPCPQMFAGRHLLVVTDVAGRQLGRISLGAWPIVALTGLLSTALLSSFVLIILLSGAYQKASKAQTLARSNAALTKTVGLLDGRLNEASSCLADNDQIMAHLRTRCGLLAHLPVEPGQTDDNSSEVDLHNDSLVALQAAEALTSRAQRAQTQLADLLELWRDAERRLNHTPSIRPARTAWLSSSFGVRSDPLLHYWVMHKGLDLAGPMGMLVMAPADGVVIWTGLRGGYGLLVVLDHGWGLQTHFAHLSKARVARGERVKRGQPIAEMGSSGRSTGSHLHYEVRQDGVPLDPRRFILD